MKGVKLKQRFEKFYLSDGLHRASDLGADAIELAQVPPGDLDDAVVEAWLEAGGCLAGDGIGLKEDGHTAWLGGHEKIVLIEIRYHKKRQGSGEKAILIYISDLRTEISGKSFNSPTPGERFRAKVLRRCKREDN